LARVNILTLCFTILPSG